MIQQISAYVTTAEPTKKTEIIKQNPQLNNINSVSIELIFGKVSLNFVCLPSKVLMCTSNRKKVKRKALHDGMQ